VSDERRAYTPGDAIYITTTKRRAIKRRTSTRTEERIGSLLAGGGMLWTLHVALTNYAGLWQLRLLPPGPVEVCALGILVWLHAKWRRAGKA
jgi:hypothetical protein